MYATIIETLTIVLLLADRIYRLRAVKEYQQAKDAQIAALQQQLDLERRNNDTALTELYKQRYESLQLILHDREQLTERLVEEMNEIELAKHQLETERKVLQQQLNPKPLVDLQLLKRG